jgi:hypothetical protein
MSVGGVAAPPPALPPLPPGEGPQERPVTRARGEPGRAAEAIGAGLARWRAETAAHELRISAVVDQVTAALGDPDGGVG